jgi:hypothetical protein
MRPKSGPDRNSTVTGSAGLLGDRATRQTDCGKTERRHDGHGLHHRSNAQAA